MKALREINRIDPKVLPSSEKTYTLSEAYKHCLALTRNHYENFPVASMVIPKKIRHHIACVYAFARTADDFADEKKYDGVRMERLKEWETHLKELPISHPTHPIFIALKDTIQKFNIPLSLFMDLLVAFKTDVMVSRYQTFEQLLNYCHYSANPIGRIVLYIMGYPAPKFLEFSDNICTALQLTNHWQDVSIDVDKDRIYLPREDLLRFGYTEQELLNKTYNAKFKRLLSFQVERTFEFFEKGKSLCYKLPGRLGFEIRLTWLGGTTILEKINEVEGNVFDLRPTLGKKDIFLIITRALKKRGIGDGGL